MNYTFDYMTAELAKISEHYENALDILSEAIGFEHTEALLQPLFERIFPAQNSLEAESFLKAIEAVAAKIFFYRDGNDTDGCFRRLETLTKTKTFG